MGWRMIEDLHFRVRRLLETHKPTVQIESTQELVGGVHRFFSELGYDGIAFVDDGYVTVADAYRVPHRKFGTTGHRDFLFFHKSAVGRVIPCETHHHFTGKTNN